MSLLKAINNGANAALNKIHVGFPSKVVTYDASRQMADLQPLVKDGADRELPQLRNVPVCFPRGGQRCYIVFDLEPGDEVWTLFSERALDEWLGQAQDVNAPTKPVDSRRFDLSDAVCIPGISPWSRALPDPEGDLVIEPGSGVVRLGADATNFVALANLVLTELQAIKSAFDSHVHTGVTTGGGSSGAPAAPMASPGSVAAMKVKGL